MRVATLEIAGMNAVHAVRAVYTAFAGVPGIDWAEVTLGRATVEHDGSVTRAMLEAAVAEAGFVVTAYRDERRLKIL